MYNQHWKTHFCIIIFFFYFKVVRNWLFLEKVFFFFFESNTLNGPTEHNTKVTILNFQIILVF